MAPTEIPDTRKATEHELKLTPSTSLQVKLLASLRTQSVDDVIHILKGVLGVGDFKVTIENVKSLIDEYFDTSDLALYDTHSVFRVRRDAGTPCLVIKKLIGQEQGEIKRTEHETDLSEETYQQLRAEGFAPIVAKEIPDLRDKRLVYNLKISNERRNFILERNDEKYRLSLDIFVYSNPKTGRTSNQQFEVEIEALNDAASAKLKGIKHNLLDVLHGFEYSKGSKYERGIRLFYIDKSEWWQLLTAWSSGTGLNWIGVILGILGLILAIVGIALTIRYAPT